MKESLESTRNIHQILIVVCTVIGIFALLLVPKDNRYSDAAQELEVLQGILKKTQSARFSYLQQVITNAAASFQKASVPITVYIYSKKETDFNRTKLTNIIEPLTSQTASFDSIRIPDFPAILKSYKDSHETGSISIRVRLLEGFPEKLEVISEGSQSEQPTRNVLVSSCSYINQFYQNGLCVDRTHATLLPKLRGILNEVAEINYSTSKSYLELKSQEVAKNANSSVEVSGLKVAGNEIHLIGPMLELALMLYFFLLISHLLRNLDAGGAPDYSQFPWIGLFNDKFSKFTFIVSIWVYPYGVALFAIYKSVVASNITIPTACWFVFVYTMVFALTAYCISQKVRQIHDRIYVS